MNGRGEEDLSTMYTEYLFISYAWQLNEAIVKSNLWDPQGLLFFRWKTLEIISYRYFIQIFHTDTQEAIDNTHTGH